MSDILHEFKAGSHRGERMPPIDDVIMNRAGLITAYRSEDKRYGQIQIIHLAVLF